MPSLKVVKQTFHRALNESFGLIRKANTITAQSPSIFSPKDLDYIYEISFIKMLTSFEIYLETSFIGYLEGKSTRVFRPKKITKSLSNEKAYLLVKRGRKYPDWTTVSEVKGMAEIFFDNGEPYSNAFVGTETRFNDMKTTRNAIAHTSRNAINFFETLVRTELPTLASNISPGQFLRSNETTTSTTYIEFYSNCLRLASDQIVRT